MKSQNFYDVIRLADNEWGNTIMSEVAEEHFRAHPDCNFVQVIEHAGWHLSYHRSGEIVGTANDMAVMRPDRPRPDSFRESFIRPVIRPDIKEVTTLQQYVQPAPAELLAA
jgi:hypothetical protein